MNKITIFDTSVCTRNTGDFIIMQSVNREINNLFSNDMIYYTLTHDKISRVTYNLNKISDYSFVGGTNLLSSNMNSYNQWKINIIDSLVMKDIILMGVGWWQYQKKPNIYTKWLLSSVLNRKYYHSVRDNYTESQLKSIGIKNVLNTGCPTMWTLTEKHCASVPKKKSDSVVFTLTDYNRDPENDKKIIQTLCNNYNKVFYWPQGSEDLKYFLTFSNREKVNVIGGNLNSYDELLGDKSLELDYVGTRLHAGIRALQKYKRTIIIGIDNRAEEKSKDFNLKVLSRDKVSLLNEVVKSEFDTDIRINEENIQRWKKQFK